MTLTVYVFVDGESHYIRCDQACKAAFGPDVELSQLTASPWAKGMTTFRMEPAVSCHPKAKFFWDSTILNQVFNSNLMHLAARAVYFTSLSGDDNEFFEANRLIRDVRFEPYVVREKRGLVRQRANVLKQEQVIEKAKGVDIALAARMLEDAYHGNYTDCVLFTSDIDYLPVIEAVRRMGKRVYVVGSGDGLGEQSKFWYVPDQFIDIGKAFMSKRYTVGTPGAGLPPS